MVANVIVEPTYFVPTQKAINFGIMQLISQYCYIDPHLVHTMILYCPSEVFLLALYYLHYTERTSNHFVTCVILACKYLDDYAMSLRAWEDITRIPVDVLRRFEMVVLKDLEYKLHVKEDFDCFCQHIKLLFPYI